MVPQVTARTYPHLENFLHSIWGIRPSLPISPEKWGISRPPLGQPGRRFLAPPSSDLGGSKAPPVRRGGHPLTSRGVSDPLWALLPASLLPAPSGRPGVTWSRPTQAVLFQFDHIKEYLLGWRPCSFPWGRMKRTLLHVPLTAPIPSSPSATNWQNPSLKCSLDADITMKNLQRTRMPHPENGPLDLSPSSQSASPSP